eukprot:738789-Prorocentrum_lima.AAC.1
MGPLLLKLLVPPFAGMGQGPVRASFAAIAMLRGISSLNKVVTCAGEEGPAKCLGEVVRQNNGSVAAEKTHALA